MPNFKVIFLKQPEIPFSRRKLRIDKIELNVIAKSFNAATRLARRKKGIPKDFYLHGVIKTGDNENI